MHAGDLNADPGTSGGPASTTSVNEQGRILSKYLQSWGFTSAHLHLNDTPSSYTFENTSKQCKSTIDHFICASHNLALFNSCHVLHDLPSNTSDHCPLFAEICSKIFCCLQQQKNKHSLYNWRKLSQKEISESYSVTLCNKLRELNPPTFPVIHQQLKSVCSTSVLPCITPVKKPFLQSCSKSTKARLELFSQCCS